MQTFQKGVYRRFIILPLPDPDWLFLGLGLTFSQIQYHCFKPMKAFPSAVYNFTPRPRLTFFGSRLTSFKLSPNQTQWSRLHCRFTILPLLNPVDFYRVRVDYFSNLHKTNVLYQRRRLHRQITILPSQVLVDFFWYRLTFTHILT